MNSKFYISLDAARLLKEKGYNEETEYTIDNNGRIWMGEYRDECDFPCPTKAQAIDWLESKGITIDIHWIRFNENRRWNYSIFNCNTCDTIDIKYICTTRLEAEEAAIIKVLTEFL